MVPALVEGGRAEMNVNQIITRDIKLHSNCYKGAVHDAMRTSDRRCDVDVKSVSVGKCGWDLNILSFFPFLCIDERIPFLIHWSWPLKGKLPLGLPR